MTKKIANYLHAHSEAVLMLISIALSLLSFYYYYKHGLITAYGDARAHENIARRVFDNLTPGFAQIGGVWLPLLHVLMLPTIWINFMWHSGISGSLVNIPMYLLSVIFIYKIVFHLTKNKLSAFIGWLVMASNINFLYLQSTPMTEVLFIATLILSVYFLLKWIDAKKNSTNYLITSAFFVFLTTINRYEGWPVALFISVVIFIIAFLKKGWKSAEGSFVLFSTIAFFGIFLWFIWETAIFHDPTYFLNSEFSAKGQTTILIRQGFIPTYKNVFMTVKAFYYSLYHVIGVGLLFGALLGVFSVMINFIRSESRKKFFINFIPLAIFFIPGSFLLLLLYIGNIPLSTPEVTIPGQSLNYFNIRYALYTLPAIAIFLALISRIKIVQVSIITLTIICSLILVSSGPSKIATIYDAQNKNLFVEYAVGKWIKSHYKGGFVLTSAAISDPIIFETGLDIRNFINEGSGKYWDSAMSFPQKYATWIIISPTDERDMVKKHINQYNFPKYFYEVKDFGIYRVYKKK